MFLYSRTTLNKKKELLCLPYLLGGFNLKMTKINFEEEESVNDLIDVPQAEENTSVK